MRLDLDFGFAHPRFDECPEDPRKQVLAVPGRGSVSVVRRRALTLPDLAQRDSLRCDEGQHDPTSLFVLVLVPKMGEECIKNREG
jgi:hypothetical protein